MHIFPSTCEGSLIPLGDPVGLCCSPGRQLPRVAEIGSSEGDMTHLIGLPVLGLVNDFLLSCPQYNCPETSRKSTLAALEFTYSPCHHRILIPAWFWAVLQGKANS